MKKNSLGQKISELFNKANLPPNSLIHDPKIKIKAKPGNTHGIQGGGRMSEKEKARHAKLNANLKCSRKRKPDFICTMD